MNKETWEERFNQEFTHDGAWAVEDNGCRVSPRQVKDFFRTELQKAREEERERQYCLMMESIPSDAENLSTLTLDQAFRLIKSFISKKPWN